jgi:ABC-type transport system substrate-binding protein
LLEQARLAADLSLRADLLGQFERLIEADLPAAFLYSPTYAYPVSSGVHGVSVGRLSVPADRFAGVTGWYVRTERKLR